MQHNPKSSTCQKKAMPRRSDGTVRKVAGQTPGERDVPREGEVNRLKGRSSASRQSAAGKVVSGQVELVRHSHRKGETTDRPSRNARCAGVYRF